VIGSGVKLFCAISVMLCLAVADGHGQATPAGALPAALRANLRDDRFDIVTSIRGLPLGVRAALQTMFGSPTLDIADPAARFHTAEPTVDSSLPTRRLVAAGCSYDYCLVYYERGATGTHGTWCCFTGHRTRRNSSGAVRRQETWRQSTTFGGPSYPERSRARPGLGSSS
jgi:hypothetical protein